MSYKAALIDNVFVLRWLTPETDDSNRILREVQSAIKSQKGPVIYAAISPAESPAPDKEVRGALVKLAEQLVRNCESVHMVFEAKGFKAAIKRNVMTGILLASRRLSSIVIHRSQGELFDRIQDHTDTGQLQNRMRELGLFH